MTAAECGRALLRWLGDALDRVLLRSMYRELRGLGRGRWIAVRGAWRMARVRRRFERELDRGR